MIIQRNWQTRRRKTKQNKNTTQYVLYTTIHGTHNVKTYNRTTQNTKKMSNTDPTKKQGVNSGAHEG